MAPPLRALRRILLLVASGAAPLSSSGSALAAQTPASDDSVVVWDAALFTQPGQRSLFLRTPNGGNAGLPLGGGDVNGDGRDDALLCAFTAAEAFVFFSPPAIAGSREGVPAAGEVTRISGVTTLGVECTIGDVNGDGLGDLILGAPGAAGPGGAGTGSVFVVFGAPALPVQVNVRGSPGVLEIQGLEGGDHFGVWVDAFDVDDDGSDDLLIGAPDADGPSGSSRQNAGEAYVLFGGPDLTSGVVAMRTFETAGRVFTAFGADANDQAGATVDAGRIDGGSRGDFVVGSAMNRAATAVYGGGSPSGGDGPAEDRPEAGEVAIVFNPARGSSVDLDARPPELTFIFGADGRVQQTQSVGDFAGEELDVGDADGDGFGDVLIGALTASGRGNLRPFTGEAYVVYGGDALRGRRIDLRTPPADVTTIYGPSSGGITGDTARLIDIDGDGREDVFIGSPTGMFIGPDGRNRTGALFFIRSPAGQLPDVIDLDDPPLDDLPMGVILAADPGDILAYSLVELDADADGVPDVLVNGMTADGLNNQFPDAGEAYVIDGQTLASRLRPFAGADLNGDGRVDVRDLQRAIAGLVGRIQLSDAERGEADTNGNGTLDVGDLTGIVDRILERNVLVPGPEASGRLSKNDQGPGYRYNSATGAFALTTANGSLLPSRVRAVRAVFSLPAGLPSASFAVVRAGAAQVHAGVVAGKLHVVVLSPDPLPLGQPLFAFRGKPPRLLGVTASLERGTLRRLRPR